MTLPRSVADVLADHVVFEIECIDRMYCNVYVPQLQHPGGLLGYIQRQLGLPIASTAPLGKITDAFSAAMRRFARDHVVPWVDFVKGQRKDDVMHEHLARFDRQEGVLFIGRAQEKTSLFRTERRRDANGELLSVDRARDGCGQPVLRLRRRPGLRAVLPQVLLVLSLQRQALPQRPRVGQTPSREGRDRVHRAGQRVRLLRGPGRVGVQAICDRLGVEQIDGLLRKWLAVLPHPFSPADREAGYHYDISILQAEFSLTQMLDRPVSGRVFFEHVIRDNLDAGRPDQVSLIFDRKLRRTGPRATPGRFRTRVITEGVTPSLHIDYKHTAIKQYHKEGRALRTETTINDTRDFRIGKRLTNLPALREIGLSANRRLLSAQRLSHNPIRAAEAFTAVHEPILTDTGARIAGLRLGDRRAHALLQALLMFRLLPSGFLNRDLRGLLAELLAVDTITAGQMSYDLRRLRAHGLITRIPRSHRYRLTDTGLHHAMLLTHTHTRLLLPGLAQLADPDPPAPSPLRTAARNYRQAIDQLTQDAGLAA